MNLNNSGRFMEAFMKLNSLSEKDLSGKIQKNGRVLISSGEYSQLFRAQWQRTRAEGGAILVCLKLFTPDILDPTSKDQGDEKLAQQLHREIDIWSKINHPNIVPFYGYILEVEGRTLTVGFVTSWCRFGNVASYLQSNPQIDEINMIHDLAEGLRYLHSQEPPIIHGNMKPENVLIGSDRRALIADFGIHTILEGFSLGNTSANLGIVGAMRFTAPELVQYSDEWPRRTTASDVWAFGCTAMQILTGERPFKSQNNLQIAHSLLQQRSPYVWNFQNQPQRMLEKCCNSTPHLRLTMSEVVQELALSIPPTVVSRRDDPYVDGGGSAEGPGTQPPSPLLQQSRGLLQKGRVIFGTFSIAIFFLVLSLIFFYCSY